MLTGLIGTRNPSPSLPPVVLCNRGISRCGQYTLFPRYILTLLILIWGAPLQAFGEIHRILKPGGRMVICCTTNKLELAELDAGVQWPACMEVFMQLDQVDAIVRAAGFGDVGVDDSDSKMYCFPYPHTSGVGG